MIQTAFCVLVVTCAAFVLVAGFAQEEFCAREGGECVLNTTCLDSTLPKGLCPRQRDLGAECCRRGPPGDLSCTSHGAVCLDTCAPVNYRRGLWCPDGQICCLWRR